MHNIYEYQVPDLSHHPSVIYKKTLSTPELDQEILDRLPNDTFRQKMLAFWEPDYSIPKGEALILLRYFPTADTDFDFWVNMYEDWLVAFGEFQAGFLAIIEQVTNDMEKRRQESNGNLGTH